MIFLRANTDSSKGTMFTQRGLYPRFLWVVRAEEGKDMSGDTVSRGDTIGTDSIYSESFLFVCDRLPC